MDNASIPPVVKNATISFQERIQFGVDVRVFCARHGLRIRELARQSGVKYYTLMDTMTGKTPGTELMPKVREYMNSMDELSHEQAVR